MGTPPRLRRQGTGDGERMEATPQEKTWVVAEFPDGESLTRAASGMRGKGYEDIDIHSPYPIHGAAEALGLRRPFIPIVALGGATLGFCTGYGLQLFSNAIDFAINVGGRSPHSVPTYIPIAFESTVLGCALSIFFGLLAMFKLPQPYHPVFESEDFRSATTHGFWLSVAAAPILAADELVKSLQALGAKQVQVVTEDQR
nr:hypothetical protein Hi04_10k_c5202_00013 [uncultured bacterium]